MRNVYEALRTKELKVERLKREVQALHTAIPLLKDEPQAEVKAVRPSAGTSSEIKATPVAAAPHLKVEWP